MVVLVCGGYGSEARLERASQAQIAKWYPRLFRTALRLTRNAEDAADLTQQTFYNALRNWDRFDGGARPTTWLHQILLNCVRDWARRRAVRSAEPLHEWTVAAAAKKGASPLEEVERVEQADRLAGAINHLPPLLRQAFIVTVMDGYTYQETAEILSVPVGTVASRVHQARRLLMDAMRQAFPEAE